MCDHCGCREITPIRRLMAEHERLLDLLAELGVTDWEDITAREAAVLL